MPDQTPQPIRLPDPIPEQPRPDEVIEVKRSTLYYIAIAVLFFVAGYIVAWAVFSSTTGGLLNEMKSAASDAAAVAVATGISKLPQGSSGQVVARPTPTKVPKQVIDVSNAPSWGPADSKVTIVEFSDFECPYCGYFFRNTYPLLKQYYGDKIHFVFRDFPLPMHPNALPSALAAQCANEQGKFWEYHDTLFNNQQALSSDALVSYAGQLGMDVPKFKDCFQSKKYLKAVTDNEAAGQGYFVAGTPTFFINGEFYEGAGYSFQAFSKIIDSQLAMDSANP